MKLDTIEKRLDLAYEMRICELEPITPHLIGPPGVGKSTIVREYAERKAKQLQKQFVDFDTLTPEDVERLLKTPDKYYVFADKRLTGLDPVDISGIPRLVNESKYDICHVDRPAVERSVEPPKKKPRKKASTTTAATEGMQAPIVT